MEKLLRHLTDLRNTLALSAMLHLLLLIAFFLIRLVPEFETAEFAEIGFISSTTSTRPPRPAPARRPAAQPAVSTEPEVDQSPPAEPEAPEPIDLPKRRMLADEEPLPLRPENSKVDPNAGIGERIPPSASSSTRHSSRNLDPGKPSAERSPALEGAPLRDLGTGTGTALQPGKAMPFTIEGDAADRRILAQVIPEYPAGLNKEAVVQIRFTLLPDGSVGQMIPVRKGEPTLEEITMAALRKWRFNPLSAAAPQKNVQGIITFRYELQ